MLGSPGPLSILWGPDHIQLYNDAYILIAAERHPGGLGRPAAETWSDAYTPFLRPIFERVFAGEAVTIKDQVVRVRGTDEEGTAERFFTASFSPIRDGTGTVAGIFHPVTETTDRVSAERRLREGEARLQGVLEGMGEAFGLLDRDFRVLSFNEAALRLETRPLGEIVGRSHWEVYPGSEHSEIGRLYKRALAEQQPVALEHRYTWEDGTARWLEMRAYPVPEGLAIFWRDASERKEAEEALRESEARVRLALQAGQLAEVTFDLDGGGVSHSAAFAELLGHPPDKRLTLAEFRAVPPGGPRPCARRASRHPGQ